MLGQAKEKSPEEVMINMTCFPCLPILKQTELFVKENKKTKAFRQQGF